MFDFFHMQIVHGDLATLLQKNFDYIGHVQIAAVHDRGEPDDGEINFPFVLGILEQQGYTGYIGAEYNPVDNPSNRASPGLIGFAAYN
jgi:hydroxypyruvate isomerase